MRPAALLLLSLLGAAEALKPSASSLQSGRAAVTRRAAVGSLGLALATLRPQSAHAQRSKMIERSSKEKTEAAKAYKLSAPEFAPGEGSDAFQAAERRRADVLAGRAPKDADRTPIRDPVSGKVVSARTYAEAIAAGDDICKGGIVRCKN